MILTFANEILNCCNRYRNEELSGLAESQEGEAPDVGKTGKEVPVCVWHQHTGRECVLVDGVVPEQEEAEHVRETVSMQHFLKDNLILWTLNTFICQS